MDEWVFWVGTTIIGLMISGLVFFLKKQFADLEKGNEKNRQESMQARKEINDRIDKLEIKLQSTIEEMPYRYTLREDFIRAVTGLDAKLDKILDKVGGSC